MLNLFPTNIDGFKEEWTDLARIRLSMDLVLLVGYYLWNHRQQTLKTNCKWSNIKRKQSPTCLWLWASWMLLIGNYMANCRIRWYVFWSDRVLLMLLSTIKTPLGPWLYSFCCTSLQKPKSDDASVSLLITYCQFIAQDLGASGEIREWS